MANKATNYLFGFISGTITGIFLGVLFFISNDKKIEKSKKTSNKNKEKEEEEKEGNFFFRNLIRTKLYSRLSNLSAKEASKYK